MNQLQITIHNMIESISINPQIIMKCPNCKEVFKKPNWHYIKCPKCKIYISDER